MKDFKFLKLKTKIEFSGRTVTSGVNFGCDHQKKSGSSSTAADNVEKEEGGGEKFNITRRKQFVKFQQETTANNA